jgi:hypothetical protein
MFALLYSPGPWPSRVETVSPWLYAPVFVIFVLVVALALGQRVLGWLRFRAEFASLGERSFISVCLGLGCLQYVPYTLGQLHLLGSTPVAIALIVVTAALAPDIYRQRHLPATMLDALRTALRPTAAKVWVAALLSLGLVLLVKALAIMPFGEDDGYHLSAPRRWLYEHRLSYLPTYTLTNTAMGFEMHYAMALALLDDAAATALHFATGVLMLLGIALSARRIGASWAGPLTIALLFIPNHQCDVIALFSRAYVDLAVGAMSVCTLLMWLLWREKSEPALLSCLGLCAGFAASFKLTAAVGAVAWLTLLLTDVWSQRGTKAVLATGLRFGIAASLPVLPWFFRNWQVTGNPLFPLLSSLVPTRDWPAEHAEVFGRYIHYYTWGVASGASLSQAARVGLVLGVAGLAVAFMLACWFWLQDGILRRLALFVGVFVTCNVLMTGLVVRYWLPAIMVAGLVVSTIVVRRMPPPASRIGWVAAALSLPALWSSVRAPSWRVEANLIAGTVTPANAFATDPFWQLWDTIHQQTEPSARVLVASFYTTFGSSSYGCVSLDRVCFTTDSQLQAFVRFDSWQAFLASLRRGGITHVVIADQQLAAGRVGFEFTAGQNEYPFCRRLVDAHGRKLAQFGHLQLYRVDF